MDASVELARGLEDRHLEAIANLERKVVAADGGRLKLEWGVLRERPSGEIRDFLCWQGDRLVGFLGLYGFGWPTAEIAGMVDPEFRRRGIATALLETALPICRRRRPARVLLVVPRNASAGAGFAVARGAALDHSEYALELCCDPPAGPEDPLLSTRDAVATDVDQLSAIYLDGFGVPFAEPAERLRTDRRRTLVVELAGTVVGGLLVTGDADGGSISGFVIASEWRGRGIGRDVLRRVCRQLRADGLSRIGIETETHNERALSLYTSLGFEPIATDDYYRLPD